MPEESGFIPVSRPWLDEREIEAVRRPILSGWVTQGPEVARFESQFAEYVGAAFACAVSSCTTALHMALLTAGVGSDDEVVTLSHSFIATANSIRHCGATPIFVDIQQETFNIDPEQVEQAITGKTKAILCVHQIGMPCDLHSILDIARRHGLIVVEDAACAIGSEIRWQGSWELIGRPHGDIACFSFHPRKILTTGDGGMITTSNAEWIENLRRLRHHGMSVQTTTRHKAREVIFESYPDLAFSYRLTDLQAAIGQVQLERLPEMLARRRRLAERYSELLEEHHEIQLPTQPEWARSNWQSYCVRLPERADQREVMQRLLDRGVATRRGIMCAHREGAYAAYPVRHSLSRSESAQDHCIILPLYHQLSNEDQQFVVRALVEACGS